MAREWKRLGDAISIAKQSEATLSEALAMLSLYREMRERCLSRSSCHGCEYYCPDDAEWQETHELSACKRITTDDVIDIVVATYEREPLIVSV